MEELLISVCTPVYNMASKVHRVFESLKKSTYKNFELIICNNGSTDNLDSVISELIRNCDFKVIYLKKEHGSKASASNVLYENSNGQFIFALDADDEIEPNAMSEAISVWESLGERQSRVWCITGRCKNQFSSALLGLPYPDNINQFRGRKQEKIVRSCKGEGFGFKRTEIIKKYKFPTHEMVDYVQESVLWKQLNKDYENYFVNNIWRTYYQNEGGNTSSRPHDKRWARDRYFTTLYMINNRKKMLFGFFEYWKSILRLSYLRIVLGKGDCLKLGSLNNKIDYFIYLLLLPLGFLCSVLRRIK